MKIEKETIVYGLSVHIEKKSKIEKVDERGGTEENITHYLYNYVGESKW